jgi:N-methylhydantoinase A
METSAPPTAGSSGGDAIKKRRPAYFAETAGYVDTPVYDRYRLTPGTRLDGPAIIEERESTTVIGPGAHVVVDERLTLIAEPAS